MEVAAVKKKMKDKAFARAVNREDIVRGAAELGMPLDDVIAGVITALRKRRRETRSRRERVEPNELSNTDIRRLGILRFS